MKGFLMGNADVVPGVSGGTVAILMGVYEQLILSIRRFDIQLIRYCIQLKWRSAAQHVHLPFLSSLLLGILSGIFCMAMLTDLLLEQTTSRQFTYAVFSGLVLASTRVILKMIKTQTGRSAIQAVFFGLIGIAIVLYAKELRLGETENVVPTHLQLFIYAAIAICAMILPGISGSMILLIFGVYPFIVDLPGKLFHQAEAGDALLQLSIFALGAVCGLICFSRLLRWLLTQQRNQTLSILTGIMFGSLTILWPFQDLQGHALPVTFSVQSFLLVMTVLGSSVLMLGLAHCSASQTRLPKKNESG
ncbi:MAG: DUF368 domain-containing protein [Planctomycetota bacterium]|nr:DUF368 domain-containing protein [Planctomycetota bacterium]